MGHAFLFAGFLDAETRRVFDAETQRGFKYLEAVKARSGNLIFQLYKNP